MNTRGTEITKSLKVKDHLSTRNKKWDVPKKNFTLVKKENNVYEFTATTDIKSSGSRNSKM